MLNCIYQFLKLLCASHPFEVVCCSLSKMRVPATSSAGSLHAAAQGARRGVLVDGTGGLPWGLAGWPHDGHLLAGCCSHDTHKRPKLLLLSHLHFCRILSHVSVLVEVLSAVTNLPVQPSWTALFKSLDQLAAQTHGCFRRFLLIRSASCRKVGSAVRSHPEWLGGKFVSKQWARCTKEERKKRSVFCAPAARHTHYACV